MPPLIKIFLLLLLLLLFFHSSSGRVESFEDGMKQPTYPVHEGIMKKMKTRKLVMVDAILDYDYAGPNPRHDPKKGKPPGGGGGGAGKTP